MDSWSMILTFFIPDVSRLLKTFISNDWSRPKVKDSCWPLPGTP